MSSHLHDVEVSLLVKNIISAIGVDQQCFVLSSVYDVEYQRLVLNGCHRGG